VTLERYLDDSIAVGAIDHAIRTRRTEAGITFYIHQQGRDGKTLDFVVDGNILSPLVMDELGKQDVSPGDTAK